MSKSQPEVWLRGPLPSLSGYLQPIAFTLLQAREELSELLEDFPEALLWERPAGLASVAFHLQHIVGVLDRLFSYARAEPLSEKQLAYLQSEGQAAELSLVYLLEALSRQIDLSLLALSSIPEASLLEPRKVGRAGLPSTVLGLYTHAAEHTMRHLGQTLVTVRLLKVKA